MQHLSPESIRSQAAQTAAELADRMATLPSRSLSACDPERTALIVVDMVNGFAFDGAMASPRVAALVRPIARLAAACEARAIPVVALADAHTPDSLELQSYPPHCLTGTGESAVCSAICEAAPSLLRIEKNSTNGFLEDAFAVWRDKHPAIDTYLVVGDCTDICVMQFVLAAKAWHDSRNRPLQVIVPTALVDTFDAPGHPADTLALFSLSFMQAAGADICADIIL